MESLVARELFGGAITAIAPTYLIDASNIRQVPDTQEVFLDPNSSISIIVEILERVEPPGFHEAIRFHFDSLAHDNSAVFTSVRTVNVIPNDRGDDTPSAIILTGVQHVPKFNRTSPDEVEIMMALYRVESKRIDLVVTFNIPTKSTDGGAVGSGGLETARSHFDTFARSLRIINHELFA